jgi:hypothetical protein
VSGRAAAPRRPGGEAAAARAAFQARGWVIVRDAVPAPLVRRLRGAAERASPDAAVPVLQVPASCLGPAARAVWDGALGATVRALLGARRLRLLQDHLLVKRARTGGAVALHQDAPYLAYLTPLRAVTVRIALDAEDAASGCMHVVDGSHRWRLDGPPAVLQDELDAGLLDRLSPTRRAALATARVAIVLRPGDASVHHARTLHWSPENGSARPRRTLVARVVDAACRVDPARLPAGARELFPTDARGRLAGGDAFPELGAWGSTRRGRDAGRAHRPATGGSPRARRGPASAP